MANNIAIHWFRQDLRVTDNPALINAAKHQHVLPIYILDDHNAGDYAMGGASRWWLHYSLASLNNSLHDSLSLYKGNPLDILDSIAHRFRIEAVYWNRCYEPWCIDRDTHVKAHLQQKGIAVQTYNGSLLWEPWTVRTNTGTPYRVFTPFYRKGCLQQQTPREPLLAPTTCNYVHDTQGCIKIPELCLLPKKIRWDTKFQSHWQIGELAAYSRLQIFIDKALMAYKDGRNFPAQHAVSRLSPHLHFGEISPNQLWHVVRTTGDTKHVDHFCSELGWREFSYSQLYYHPDLPKRNVQSKFDAFPWKENMQHLRAWQQGNTGIPMVDAGMRELWQTGYMHNRLRMIVGSFLVKNLLIHWHYGERWFWDTLVDADLANNSASWQWIAGCGADSAPFFRIFNPVMQGQKFDPDGSYVRRFIPEISALPTTYLFSPWQAPQVVLHNAGIRLGDTYPVPIVDLKQSRQVALAAFQSLV